MHVSGKRANAPEKNRLKKIQSRQTFFLVHFDNPESTICFSNKISNQPESIKIRKNFQ